MHEMIIDNTKGWVIFRFIMTFSITIIVTKGKNVSDDSNVKLDDYILISRRNMYIGGNIYCWNANTLVGFQQQMYLHKMYLDINVPSECIL